MAIKKIKVGEVEHELQTTMGNVDGLLNALDNKMNKNNPTGTGSFSINRKANTTVGSNSFAMGNNATASGNYSHAEGVNTTSSGIGAHTEGLNSTASGLYSHAECGNTTASGQYAHAEGNGATASAPNSHAEGYRTTAASENQHVQGQYNITDSDRKYAHIVGNGYVSESLQKVLKNAHTLDWDGNAWFSGNVYVGSDSGVNKDDGSVKLATMLDIKDGTNLANGVPWIENDTIVDVLASCTLTVDTSSYIVDIDLPENLVVGRTYTVSYNGVEYECVAVYRDGGIITLGDYDGYVGNTSTGEPFMLVVIENDFKMQVYVLDESSTINISISYCGDKYYKLHESLLPDAANIHFKRGNAHGSMRHVYSTPEDDSYTIGTYAFAEGFGTTAPGMYSHAEGWNTTASGDAAHAEGSATTASGNYSHTEGSGNTASGMYSHAEGNGTTASGAYSHTEGQGTVASSRFDHAEGRATTASGTGSHAEGYQTLASGQYQHVQGKYNIQDTNTYAHIVGNGSSSARSNAHTVDWDGNAWFAGDVYVGSTSGANKDVGSVKLATQDMALHFIPSDSFTVIAGSDTSNAYLAAKWAVPSVDSITTPKNGMSITLRTPAVGYKGGILLSIDGGTTYYPIVRNVSTLITTTYGAGSTVILTFNSTQTAKPYLTAGTATTVTGCWQIADYDSNNYAYWRVYRQDSSSSYNKDYPLIASRTVASSLGTVGTESSYEAVYGMISDTDANIPKTNPYTGEVKVKSLTVNGDATVAGQLVATTFKGELDGNAATATKATQDGNGDVIADTYQQKITGAPIQFVYYNTNEYDEMPEVVEGAILIKYTADLVVEEVV